MGWSRRGLVLGCAALAASCASRPRGGLLTADSQATVQPAPTVSLARVAPPPLEPRARTPLDPLGLIPKDLVAAGLAALERHREQITTRDAIFLVDFKAHSSRERFFRLDLGAGSVTAFRTAHGRGSDPEHTGFAQMFSNTPDSNASSLGAYVTGGQGFGLRHGANVGLDGLDPTNSEARDRAIIVHAADYCEPAYLSAFGKLGRSNGCFSVSNADLETLRPALDRGRLLLASI